MFFEGGPIKLKKIENVETIEITENIKTLSKIKTLKEMVKNAEETGIELIHKTSGFGFGSGFSLFGDSSLKPVPTSTSFGGHSFFSTVAPPTSSLFEPAALKFGFGKVKRTSKSAIKKDNVRKM